MAEAERSSRKRFLVDWLEDNILKLDIMSRSILSPEDVSDWLLRFEGEQTGSSRKRFLVDWLVEKMDKLDIMSRSFLSTKDVSDWQIRFEGTETVSSRKRFLWLEQKMDDRKRRLVFNIGDRRDNLLYTFFDSKLLTRRDPPCSTDRV